MRMKVLCAVLLLSLILCGCASARPEVQIAATTLPVYQFTTALCDGTGISVTRIVTESVSCLHDYTLKVSQMRDIESSRVVILSGAGLEEFLEDALTGAQQVIDASAGIDLLPGEEEFDPHIWLSPVNASAMAENICRELSRLFPEKAEIFNANLLSLQAELSRLNEYGRSELEDLRYRELITFHDGFAYFAQAFNLDILAAVEEESGSEASAAQLIELIELSREQGIPAIFTETNGPTSAAAIISAETGAAVYSLDMAMAGDDYFTAMYHNIDIIREALS